MIIPRSYDNPLEDLGISALRLGMNLVVKHARVPGVRASVRTDRCNGCGNCVRKGFCRVGAISLEDRKARVDSRACRGCTRCTHLCPQGALVLELSPPAPVRHALRIIDRKVTNAMRDRP